MQLQSKSLLGAALYAQTAAYALFFINGPGLCSSVNGDGALRALLCAESAENAGVINGGNFLLFFEGENLLGALADADTALDTLGFINGPGLVGSVNSDSTLRAVLCAETAVYAAVCTGKLALGSLLDAAADCDQLIMAGSSHMIVLGHGNGLLVAEICTGTAESAGGKVEFISDLLTAFYIFKGTGNGRG